MKTKKLNEQQKKFCNEYLLDFNATDAYIRAGYKVKNRNVAHATAAKLLRNATVQKYLGRHTEKAAKKAEVKKDEIVAELKKLAFSNVADFVILNEDSDAPPVDKADALQYRIGEVRLKDWSKLTRDQLAAVSELTTAKDGTIKFKLYDKTRALRDLGEHLGMFKIGVELPKSFEDFLKTLK